MYQQNKQMNTPTSSNFPVKRKRGRPRKDENLSKKENTLLPVTPPPHLLLHPPDNTNKIDHVKVNSTNDNNIDNDMIGKVVSGVIEGTFDAGYFLSVRAGNSNTLMRGVVFQPGHFTPISAGNDIAPQVKMYTRKEFPAPSFNQQSQQIATSVPQSSEVQSDLSPFTVNNQTAAAITVTQKQNPSPLGEKDHHHHHQQQQQHGPLSGFTNQPTLPLKNLRMAEKDDVAHAYEITKDGVSESASESMVDILLGNETIEQVSQGQNQDVECHGLESNQLVPNELQNPNLEFHQTTMVVTNKHEAMSPQHQLVESGFKPSETNTLSTETLERDLPEPMNLEQNEPKRICLEHHQPLTVVDPQPLQSEPVSEQMNIVTENTIHAKNDEDSQTAKMETNDIAGAADYVEGGSQSKPEFRAEDCVFPEKLDPQNCSFPSQDADMNFGIGEVIPPTQSHCYPSYVPENENR